MTCFNERCGVRSEDHFLRIYIVCCESLALALVPISVHETPRRRRHATTKSINVLRVVHSKASDTPCMDF